MAKREQVNTEVGEVMTGQEVLPPVVALEESVATTPAVTTSDNDWQARWPEYVLLDSPTAEDIQACWTPGRTDYEAREMSQKYMGRYAKGPTGAVVAVD